MRHKTNYCMVLIRRLVDNRSPFIDLDFSGGTVCVCSVTIHPSILANNKTSATWKTKTSSQSRNQSQTGERDLPPSSTSNPTDNVCTPIACRQRATLGGQASTGTTCFSWGSFQFSGLAVPVVCDGKTAVQEQDKGEKIIYLVPSECAVMATQRFQMCVGLCIIECPQSTHCLLSFKSCDTF